MRSTRKLCLTAALGALAVLGAVPAAAGAATFSNPATITGGAGAVSSTYPSTISVAGLTGPVTKVRATVFGLTGDTSLMQMLLVGPGGQSTVLMRSRCGDTNNGPTLVFDDAASASLPGGSCSGLSGSFKPTDPDPGDAFTAPAPPLPHGSALAAFNGTDPNGTWSLYVEDDVMGGIRAYSLGGGWSLDIDTPPAAATAKKCKKGSKLKTIKKKGKKPVKKCVKKKRKKK
jgi:hypothetical protein